MKRFYFLLIITLTCVLQESIAQKYQMNITAWFKTGGDRMECDTRMEYKVYGNTDNQTNVVLMEGTIIIPYEIGKNGSATVIPTPVKLDGYPTRVVVNGFHKDNRTGNDGGCKNNKGVGSSTLWLYDDDYPCVSNKKLTNFMGNYGGSYPSYFQFSLIPIHINENNVTYTHNGQAAIFLPESNKITVSAPSGYHPKSYQWQYQVGNDGPVMNLPEQFQGLNTFDICAKDFLTNIGEIAGKKNVTIILNVGCGSYPEIRKPLSVMLDCPTIQNITPHAAPCKAKPGNMIVELSRELYAGETLNFKLYTAPFYGSGDIADQIGSDRIEYLGDRKFKIKGIAPGKYGLGILSYLGVNKEIPTFSDLSDKFFRKDIIIKEPDPFHIISTEKFSPVCGGVNDGSIQVTAQGGSGLYWIECISVSNQQSYQSEQSSGTATITGLPAGDYDLYLYDSEGCQIDEDFIPVYLEEPEDPVEIIDQEQREASLDENNQEEGNGLLSITFKGGTHPYSVVWRETDQDGTIVFQESITKVNPGGIYTSTLRNINSGGYYVEVMDAKGCRTEMSFNLPQAPAIYVRLQSTGTIHCAEDETGSLHAEISGGFAPYTATWYKDDSICKEHAEISETDDLTELGIGQYRLLITDAIGSRAWSQTITLTELTHFDVSFNTTMLRCHDDNNGYLEVSVNGGQAPYTYEWSDGSIGNRIGNLTAGEYTVRIVDSNNCAASATGYVEAPQPLNVESSILQPSCSEMANGEIYLNISGGTTPYQVMWFDNSSQNYIKNLSTGNYNVSVSDFQGCETITKTFKIQAPEPVNATVQEVRHVSAFDLPDGFIKIRVSGGSSPYSLTGKNGASVHYPQLTTVQPDQSITYEFLNLNAGNYIFEIKDKNYRNQEPYNLCKTLLEIEIIQPPKLKISAEIRKQITCFDGNDGILVAHAEGGIPFSNGLPYDYEWFRIQGVNKIPLSVNDSILNDASKGKYQVRIKDKNNVETFTEIEIDHPRLLTLRLEPKNVVCDSINSGSIRSFAGGGTGGYEYLWSSGETTSAIEGKVKGNYSLTVTDSRGCSITADTIILSPSDIQFRHSLELQSCAGHHDAAIYLDPQGGKLPYSFQWSNGKTDMFVENLMPGTYTVTLTDAEHCVSDTTFVIPVLPPIKVNLIEAVEPQAFGRSDGSLSVEITGGYQPYKIVWTNERGDVLFDDSVQVQNGKALHELKNIPTGTYFLRMEDTNYPTGKSLGFDPCGCLHEWSVFLPEPPLLEASIEESHYISCYESADGSFRSKVQGGVPFKEGLPYLYTWYYNDTPLEKKEPTISGLTDGSYRLKITDANGIEAWSEKVELRQPDLLSISLTASDLKCSRDTNGWAEVNVTGGTAPYNYEWSTGSQSSRIEQVSRGKYMIWVQDSRGCEQIGNIQIAQFNSIQISSTLIPPTCNGGGDGEIRISLTGGAPPYSYRWDDGNTSPVLSGLKKGTYTLTVTDSDECSYETKTYELSEPDSIPVDLGNDRELCIGQEHEVEAKVAEPAHSFNWFSPTGNLLFTGEKYTLSDPGTYLVEATTNKGCKATGNITITRDNQKIEAEFMVASKVPIHDEIHFVNITDSKVDSIEWILPDGEGYSVASANQDVLEVIFSEYGVFTFGMRSFFGNCYETVCKSIHVMNKYDIEDYEDAEGPTLRVFSAYPNPAKERFSVEIELGKASKAVLSLIDSGTGRTVERRILNNDNKFKEEFYLPTGNSGTFILHLTAPEVRSSLKVIVKN